MTRPEEELATLYADAYRRYGVLCLWSKRPVERPGAGNARSVATCLRLEGDSEARRLALQLEEAADAVDAASS